MKLLVITQKVDRTDSNLGFFHRWLELLASQVEQLTVICLQQGEFKLPPHVTVYSLGKEERFSRITYFWRFFSYIWSHRHEYDGVFVHMNPEYVILGGIFWRMWDKKILLWYVHKAVNLRLRFAEKLVHKIFTASPESFRLPSRKVEIVGHGIDAELFVPASTSQEDVMLLWAGRISPSKDVETVIRAIRLVVEKKLSRPIHCTVLGSPITQIDQTYYDDLKRMAADLSETTPTFGFRPARPFSEMPNVYQRYQIFIHTSQTGSLDKVVLEALASGLTVLTSSEAFRELGAQGVVQLFPANNPADLANHIEKITASGILPPNLRGREYVVANHNLQTLVGRIVSYFKK